MLREPSSLQNRVPAELCSETDVSPHKCGVFTTFHLRAQGQNGGDLRLISGKHRDITVGKGAVFDKLQLSIGLQLMQHFSIL